MALCGEWVLSWGGGLDKVVSSVVACCGCGSLPVCCCLRCAHSLPFNRLMMTRFQFPVAKWVLEHACMVHSPLMHTYVHPCLCLHRVGDPPVKVSEVMGEGLYSWTVPRQML